MRRGTLDPGRSRGTRRSGPGRPGFTLLEITLAATIAVLLLAALYAAVRVQLNHAQAGRNVVEQSTLARQILRRIDNDVRAAVALSDPARFRLASSSSQSGSGTGSASSSGSGATPPAPAQPSSPPSPGSSTTTSDSGTSTTGATMTSSFTLPFGVKGDSATLTL